MKKIFTFFALINATNVLFAQYSPDWAVPTPDYLKAGKMIATDTSNNVIAVGYRPAFAGAAHIYTRKFDPSGNLLWEQTDSTGIVWKFEMPSWLNTDKSNNIYVSGYSYTGTSNVYTDSIVVLKYDPNGSLIWKRNIGHPWPSALPLRSELDANGNIYIGTVGLSPGFELIKLDSAGNVIFFVSNASALNQSFNSMRLKDHLVVLTSYAANGTQASVVAFDTSGTFLWSIILPGRGGMDVEIDDNLNCYILTQNFDQVSPTSDSDIQLYKLSAAGIVLDQYDYDFSGSHDVATRMTLVNNKISIIGWSIQTGFAYMDWITFQTDLNGNKLWDARYDYTTFNDEKPSWISANNNGDVYVSGQGGPDTVGFNGSIYLRYVTAKFQNGSMQWVDANPYQGYIGVSNVIGKDCGLYVLGEYAITVIHYEDSCATTTSTQEMLNTNVGNLRLYPNPATSITALELINETGVSEVKITISDLAGREIKTLVVTDLKPGKVEVEIDVTDLNIGVYICKIVSNLNSRSMKFVKR